MRKFVPLVRRFAKPDQSLGEVLLYAQTLPVHESDPPLSIGAAASAGRTQQSHRHRVVVASIGRLAVLVRPGPCFATQDECENAADDE